MTSIDFLNKVHKSLDSQEYSLSYSPAKSKNYMLYCNGNFIGGLFDEELCFVYADSVSELLGQPEPVYRGYSSTAQHRMLVIPEEHWEKALKLLYAEKFDWSRLVYDITYTSIGAAVVEDFYDENVVFLRFCFEKELLKKNPLDRQGRILRMVYLNQDLTNIGKNLFPALLDKFLAFYDRKGKTSLGNHAATVVHRSGEGVPQPDNGIRWQQHDRRKQNLYHPSQGHGCPVAPAHHRLWPGDGLSRASGGAGADGGYRDSQKVPL